MSQPQTQMLRIGRLGNRVVFNTIGATDAALQVKAVSVAVTSAVLEIKGGAEPLYATTIASTTKVVPADYDATTNVARIDKVNGDVGIKGFAFIVVEVETPQTTDGSVEVTLYPERYEL